MTGSEHHPPSEKRASRADDILCTALGISDKQERATYVDKACDGHKELRHEVLELLSLQERAETLFDKRSPSRITAAEVVNTITDIPEFFTSMKPALPDDDEVGKQIGNYRLLQKIGEGGVGNVYLAQQDKPVRRQVALKIIKAGMDTKSVIARFEAERQALAIMDHPNIAHVLNAGETETGRPYFIMDLVHGERITTYCNENKQNIPQRLKLFIQICNAIQHAHQKGIIHRDIKPSNVLITRHNGAPSPVVIDFGIAKATGEDLLTEKTVNTGIGPLIGTPAYMSPEQTNLTQIDIDTRSDIYSLGALLYELLTDSPPFDHHELLKAGLEEMCRILRQQDPPLLAVRLQDMSREDLIKTAETRSTDLATLSRILNGDLNWIALKAMNKERDRRYESVSELATDIRRFLDSEPVIARPPSRLYLLQKLVRRNRGTFAYIGIICLLLLSGTGISIWLLIRERAARQSEQKLLIESNARTQIAQAALLLSRGLTAEADRLVEAIKIPVVKPSLEASGVFRSLADWHVQQGQWETATDCYLKLQQANQLDKSNTTEEMTRDLLGAGPALILAGRHDEYRQFVQETIRRFSDTTDPSAAEQVVKNSLILPEEKSVLEELAPLAEVIHKSIDANEGNSWYRGWRTLALSLYEYRLNHLKNAMYWSRKSLSVADHNPPRVAMNHIVLSMSHTKTGNLNAARSELIPAREAIQRALPEGTKRIINWGTPDTGVWHDWVIALLLLQEAESLIDSTAP